MQNCNNHSITIKIVFLGSSRRMSRYVSVSTLRDWW